jgi:hypothetical protein
MDKMDEVRQRKRKCSRRITINFGGLVTQNSMAALRNQQGPLRVVYGRMVGASDYLTGYHSLDLKSLNADIDGDSQNPLAQRCGQFG